jgi:hypothetical protein
MMKSHLKHVEEAAEVSFKVKPGLCPQELRKTTNNS